MAIDKTTILQSIRNGDPMNHLEVLYKEEFPKMQKYVFKNNGNEADAMDVFQETIMVFFSHVKLGKFKEEYDIGAFMFVVGRNIWRKKNKNKILQEPIEADYNGYCLSEDPYEEIFSNEKKDLIKQLFFQLGENCKAILSAVIYDRLSMREIADKYGYASEVTAKTRHYKCKQRLIKLVKANKHIENEIRYSF